MIAVTSLLVLVLVGVLASRFGALALVATGVPNEIALFQARSALTGVGYTTSESEQIVGHPVRRRIVMGLMLAGNAGFVTLAGTLMLSFATSGSTGDALTRLVTSVVGVAAILWLMSRQPVERIVTKLLSRTLKRWADLEFRDYHTALRLSADYAVTELAVRRGDWIADRPLVDLELPAEGVLVLAIQRSDGDFIGTPSGLAIVRPGDSVFMYGRTEVLAGLDHRSSTPSGDEEHERFTHEQQAIRRRLRPRMPGRRPQRRRADPAPS